MNNKNIESKLVDENGEELILISTIINEDAAEYCFFSDKNFYQNRNNEYFKVTDENLINKLLENFKSGFSDVIKDKNIKQRQTEVLPEIELPKLGDI